MIKLQARENFTLGEFNKIKNLERVNPSKSEDGRLMKGDVFEADEKLAKYLLNETSNPVNRAVVDLVEVVPEIKEEKKEEKKTPRTKKTIAKK